MQSGKTVKNNILLNVHGGIKLAANKNLKSNLRKPLVLDCYAIILEPSDKKDLNGLK
jgi:hypothetical protein